MNIIFGKEQALELQDKYTVLELDTIQFIKTGEIITAYCAIENLPFSELSEVFLHKTQHEELMNNYRSKNWIECQNCLKKLIGKWAGQMDSFYDHISSRVNQYVNEEPGPDWNPIIQK